MNDIKRPDDFAIVSYRNQYLRFTLHILIDGVLYTISKSYSTIIEGLREPNVPSNTTESFTNKVLFQNDHEKYSQFITLVYEFYVIKLVTKNEIELAQHIDE